MAGDKAQHKPENIDGAQTLGHLVVRVHAAYIPGCPRWIRILDTTVVILLYRRYGPAGDAGAIVPTGATLHSAATGTMEGIC